MKIWKMLSGNPSYFLGAPDDATVTIKSCLGSYWWAKEFKAGSPYCPAIAGRTLGSEISNLHEDGTLVAERQLVVEEDPSQWDGKGTPPAGITCEMYEDGVGWDVVTVKYLGEKNIVVQQGDQEYAFELSTCEFRPLGADPKKLAVQDMLDIYFKHDGSKELPNSVDYESMAAVYDAGYRKVNSTLIADMLDALKDAVHAHDKHGEHPEWDFARSVLARATAEELK